MLDLTQTAKTFDDVCGWVTRAIARELTDETRLQRGDERAHEAALACGPARTYRRRGGRGPFGAGVPLPQGRGAGARAAGVGPAGAVHHARRSPGTARSRVRAVRAWWSSSTGGSRTSPRISGRTRPGTTPPPRTGSSRCGTAGRRSSGSRARPPPRWPRCFAAMAGAAGPGRARLAARSSGTFPDSTGPEPLDRVGGSTAGQPAISPPRNRWPSAGTHPTGPPEARAAAGQCPPNRMT